MRREKGLNKNMTQRLLLAFILVLSIVSSAIGSKAEKNEEEERKDRKNNQLLVLPIVYYTPETRIAGGLGGIYYLRSLENRLMGHPSTIFMDVIYTQNKQLILEITPDLYLKEGKFHLVGYVGFKRYTDKFFGIGSQSTKDMEEDYSYRAFKLKCSLRKRISPSFYVGIQYDLDHSKITEIEPGGLLDSGGIPGDEGGTFSGLSFLAVRDNRDNTFFPTKGTLLQTQAMFCGPVLGSDYRFQNYIFDFRQYLTVFSKHVLAFQQNVNVTSGRVPFQWLPMLGGPWILRGYFLGRFRDKSSIFLQMEYRMPLFWRLSAAGFVGYGDVADKLNKFRLNDFKISGGLGIRYQVNRRSGTNVRLDFGFARGSFGVYAMINEAF